MSFRLNVAGSENCVFFHRTDEADLLAMDVKGTVHAFTNGCDPAKGLTIVTEKYLPLKSKSICRKCFADFERVIISNYDGSEAGYKRLPLYDIPFCEALKTPVVNITDFPETIESLENEYELIAMRIHHMGMMRVSKAYAHLEFNTQQLFLAKLKGLEGVAGIIRMQIENAYRRAK